MVLFFNIFKIDLSIFGYYSLVIYPATFAFNYSSYGKESLEKVSKFYSLISQSSKPIKFKNFGFWNKSYKPKFSKFAKRVNFFMFKYLVLKHCEPNSLCFSYPLSNNREPEIYNCSTFATHSLYSKYSKGVNYCG